MRLPINMRSIITRILLIIPISFTTGCYTFNSINVSEYEEVEEKDGKPNEIYVKTKDQQWYHFTNFNYHIENDTLYAEGINKTNTTVYGQTVDVKIALSDIQYVKIEELDGLKTAGFVIGSTALILLLIVIYAAVAVGVIRWKNQQKLVNLK